MFGRVSGALFGVLATGFVLSPQSPLNEGLCNSLEDHPSIAGWVCTEQNIKISDSSAQGFIDSWTKQLGGSRREVSTWRFLSRGADVQAPPADYVERWRPVVFAFRISNVSRDPKQFNVFTATIERIYYVDEVDVDDPPFSVDRVGVDDIILRFDLALDSKGRVTSLMPQTVDRDPHPGFKPLEIVRAAVDSDFYDETQRVSDSGLSFAAGARARAVCEREVANSWWTWTNLGWVSNEDLLEGDVELANLATCPLPPP